MDENEEEIKINIDDAKEWFVQANETGVKSDAGEIAAMAQAAAMIVIAEQLTNIALILNRVVGYDYSKERDVLKVG